MTERPQDEQNFEEESSARGQDDRTGEVNPAENPAPHSPEPDEDAIRKGEEILDRIKPY
ncbi:MAG: hypothetical protein JOZ73_11595 [Solirubrobacterales bacterium]|nr:hypothetical protein [Solirubrobacterales bacterium]